MRSAINKKLKQLSKRDDVLILGQSVADPFGGAAKVTRGVDCINLPISEAGSMGFCTGLAMGGFKPILEIMFFDFITLIADQVINIYDKIRPGTVVIRTMKGPKEYGPTHSQNMEDIIDSWPLEYWWVDKVSDYDEAIELDGLTVLIEDKNDYSR